MVDMVLLRIWEKRFFGTNKSKLNFGIFTVVASPSDGALEATVSINVLKNKALTLEVLLLFIGIQTNKGLAPVFDVWTIINSPSVFESL